MVRRLGLLLCLLGLVSACGGGGRRATPPRRLPRALAHAWAVKADAVAQAANAGDSCRASELAAGLAQSVGAHQARVPLSDRRVLLPAVDRLASGLTCTVTTVETTTVPPETQPKPKPPKQPKPPHPPGHDHGHGHHDGGGDGGPAGGGDG
jgi:outer membrane biosynthesis protein TonB